MSTANKEAEKLRRELKQHPKMDGGMKKAFERKITDIDGNLPINK